MTIWTDPTDGTDHPLVTVACGYCGDDITDVFAHAANRVILCDDCDDELYQRSTEGDSE